MNTGLASGVMFKKLRDIHEVALSLQLAIMTPRHCLCAHSW